MYSGKTFDEFVAQNGAGIELDYILAMLSAMLHATIAGRCLLLLVRTRSAHHACFTVNLYKQTHDGAFSYGLLS